MPDEPATRDRLHAAMSRALNAVEPDLLRPVSGWLLAELSGIDPVLLEQLAELDWPTLLLGRPGWSFDATTGRCSGSALRRAQDHPRRESYEDGRWRLILMEPERVGSAGRT